MIGRNTFICIFIGFYHLFKMSHAFQMLLSKRDFFFQDFIEAVLYV